MTRRPWAGTPAARAQHAASTQPLDSGFGIVTWLCTCRAEPTRRAVRGANHDGGAINVKAAAAAPRWPADFAAGVTRRLLVLDSPVDLPRGEFVFAVELALEHPSCVTAGEPLAVPHVEDVALEMAHIGASQVATLEIWTSREAAAARCIELLDSYGDDLDCALVVRPHPVDDPTRFAQGAQ